MAKLTDSIGTFQTGDLVFTRFPPKGTQPIHVTLFLDAKSGVGPGYVHAGATHLEVAKSSTYADDKDSGGYLRAFTTNATVRTNSSAVAQVFAQTAKRTPYGSYPSQTDFGKMGITPKSPHASRFTGMIRTTAIENIPFEFASLHRLLKWTLRAIEKAPLSENRGITCAAFIAACHQVARMNAFLELTGTSYQPDKLKACLKKLNGLVETKASLRKELEVLAEDKESGKKIYRDQAYRENSNRKLTAKGAEDLKAMAKDVKTAELDKDIKKKAKDLSELEKFWLTIQTQMLEIPAASAQLLEDIIGPTFMFDAKYVSSPVLADRIQKAKDWSTTIYENY